MQLSLTIVVLLVVKPRSTPKWTWIGRALLQAWQRLLRPWRSSVQSHLTGAGAREQSWVQDSPGARMAHTLPSFCSHVPMEVSITPWNFPILFLHSSIPPVWLETLRKRIVMMHFRGGAHLWTGQVCWKVQVPEQTWLPPLITRRSFRGRNYLLALPNRPFPSWPCCPLLLPAGGWGT